MKLSATKLGSLFVIYLLSMSSVYAMQKTTNADTVANQDLSQDWKHRTYMSGDPEKDQDRDRDQTDGDPDLDRDQDQDQDRDQDRLHDQDDPDLDRDRLRDQDHTHQ